MSGPTRDGTAEFVSRETNVRKRERGRGTLRTFVHNLAGWQDGRILAYFHPFYPFHVMSNLLKEADDNNNRYEEPRGASPRCCMR